MIGNSRADLIEFLCHSVDDLAELLAHINSVTFQIVADMLQEIVTDTRNSNIIHLVEVRRHSGSNG